VGTVAAPSDAMPRVFEWTSHNFVGEQSSGVLVMFLMELSGGSEDGGRAGLSRSHWAFVRCRKHSNSPGPLIVVDDRNIKPSKPDQKAQPRRPTIELQQPSSSVSSKGQMTATPSLEITQSYSSSDPSSSHPPASATSLSPPWGKLLYTLPALPQTSLLPLGV
jgi:hypothetical protein